MTVDVSPTTKTPTHHISLENGSTKYGLILTPNANAIQRRPKATSSYVPFTQNDWSGGRGLRNATDDRSRFADSKRLNTRRPGQIALGGLETYTLGHRKLEQYMPSDAAGLTWVSLLGTNRYMSILFVASGTGNRLYSYFWIRRRGTPASTLTVEVRSLAGTLLLLSTATVADIEDTVSQLREFILAEQVGYAGIASGTSYYLRIYPSTADSATDYWQVGVDAATATGSATYPTQTSSDGITYANCTFSLFFRLVDDSATQGTMFFTYKSQLYMLTRPPSSTTPKLYVNGYRGVATSTSNTLTDSTQNWATNALVDTLLLIIDGPNSEWSQPYKTINSNSATQLGLSSRRGFGKQFEAGKSVYVILGTDVWTEITGHGLTVLPTDIADAGDVVYFAQGDTVKMRRMQEINIGGTWTRTFAEEDNYAKLLMVYKDPTKSLMMMKANDYDNSNRPSVAIARAEAWGTRLKFPWLIDACEATTGWTFVTGTTGTADASLFKTGSSSVKMAISPTAAGVFAYRTFSSAISLFFQKKIRMWVYADFTIDPGQIALRLSTATDLSTSIQDIAFPALVGGEWKQITLAFNDANVGLGAVKTMGFIKAFTGALNFYVDGIESIPDGSEIPLGNDLERITGLELYGDPQTPWVLRSGSIGFIENGLYNTVPIREYSQVENIHNGVGHLVHDVYLYVSFLQGIEQYYRANLDDVGPNKDEGLPQDRQGYITSMVGYPDRFLFNVDAGALGTSSIMTRKDGHHEEYRCDAIGKRIHEIFLQVIPGDMADRLWFSEGEDVGYLPMPGNTVNELTDPTYRFTHEGVLELAWIGDDQQRIFSSVKLGLENVSAARCIEWDYKLDEETTWTPTSTPFTTGPVQKLSLNKTGKRLKVRFRPQSNDNTETPRITSINIATTVQPDTHYTYSMNFAFDDNGRDLLGNIENYTRAETLIQQLDAWMTAKTPLTMHSISEIYDNKIVVLDPFATNPLAFVPNEQQEKQSATLIASEPE
jgi:hypothetical protein